MFLEECKHVFKEQKYIIEDIEISANESDKEDSSEYDSDQENSNQENLNLLRKCISSGVARCLVSHKNKMRLVASGEA